MLLERAIKSIAKHAKISYLLFKIGIEKANQYAIEWVYIVVTGFLNLISLYLWYYLTNQGTTPFNGWSFMSLAVLTLTFNFIGDILVFIGLTSLLSMASSPKEKAMLSTVLTKPVHPIMYMMNRYYDIQEVIHILINILALSFILYLQPQNLLPYLLASVLGLIILFLMNYTIFAFVLAFDRGADALVSFNWSLIDEGMLPLTETKGALKFFFTFVYSVIFAAAVPAKVFATGDVSLLLPGLVVVAILIIASKLIYKWAWKRFEAVGG